MIKYIKHKINLVKNSLRDVGIGVKRSPKWRKIEHDFIKSHESCEACGSKIKLNVHHIVPFHISPELELDPNNLITLCMGEKECHLHIGHGGSFKQYCPDVRKYAATVLSYPDKFDSIVKLAFDNRIVN